MKKNKTLVIDEKTPLLLIAGPMFMELFLNILLNNVDTMMLHLSPKHKADDDQTLFRNVAIYRLD